MINKLINYKLLEIMLYFSIIIIFSICVYRYLSQNYKKELYFLDNTIFRYTKMIYGISDSDSEEEYETDLCNVKFRIKKN